MGTLKKQGGEHLIYEHIELGCLIAIEKINQNQLKKYWKKNKGKSSQPDDKINGYKLIHDDEQNSLKIDFSKEEFFEIRFLNKFE